MKIVDMTVGSHCGDIVGLPIDNKKINCSYYCGLRLIFPDEEIQRKKKLFSTKSIRPTKCLF
jgi:hypothetical protein